nr:tetratricopeptide repeat protein [Candidatus Sigynarchaeum springense]
MAYSVKKEYDEATYYLKKALDLEPTNANVWLAFGLMYKNKRDYDVAIRYFKETIGLIPNEVNVWVELGNTYALIGKAEECIQCHDKALSIEPANTHALMSMGILHAERGHREESIRCYMKALQGDPRLFDAWALLGIEHVRMNSAAEVERCVNKANEMVGDDVYKSNVLSILGRLFIEKNDLLQARSMLDKALDLNPEHVGATANLGYLTFKEGDVARGEELVKQAINIEPLYYRFHLYLAEIYAASNRPTEAVAECKKSLELLPGFEKATLLLGQLEKNVG